ncbi:MAG: hypothetical protein MK066_00495 [Crocinitomicaceae bacterium]|nr:hypothetical protein [Crocinitomicaceae bacterium]
MKINPRYIQLVGDAAIPLLGFFIWDWSLYFILLFYFIDLLMSEVLMHVKSSKIIVFQGEEQRSSWIYQGAISLLILLAGITAIHGAMAQIDLGIDFQDELIAFWSYTELGIQQGYILVPLIAFAGYQQYKLTFLMRAKYRTAEVRNIWKRHHITLILLLSSAGVALGLSFFVTLPEMIYVLLIVVGCTTYSWFFKNDLQQ